MSPIAEAVQAWRNQQIDSTQLLRAVVSYPHWKFPISEQAALDSIANNEPPRIQFSTDENGKNRFALWSTEETYASWAKAANAKGDQHFIDTLGSWIFSLPLGDTMDEIGLDPLTPDALYYNKEQIPALRAMAAAVSIEKDLAELRTGASTDGAVVRVRQHPEFRIAIGQSAEGQRLILAPDNQGRALAAVFTAEDCFYAFLPEAQKHARSGEEVLCMQTDGARLFKMLAGMKNLTGMVFNCSGPVKPVAFAAGFSQVVLEA